MTGRATVSRCQPWVLRDLGVGMPHPPGTVFVPGEAAASRALAETLAERIRDEIRCAVAVPVMGERVRLD